MTTTSRAHTKAQDDLVATIVGADIDETITDADVTAADEAAAAAEQALEQIERHIEDGTDTSTTAEELEAHHGKSRIARLFAKGAAARAERAAKARRLRACDDLRAEIEAYVGNTGSECTKLLRAVEDATKAFVAKIDERNRHVVTWHQRAQALGVGRHHMPITPPKSDGRLATAGHGRGVIAGIRRVEEIDSLSLLRGVLSEIRPETVNTQQSVVKGLSGAARPYEDLANLDGEFDPLPADTVFYRGENGGVFAFAPDRVPDNIRKTGTQLSRKAVEQLGGNDGKGA